MSSLDRSLTSWMVSWFQALEENPQRKTRIFAAIAGILVTIGMWLVHLTYPYIFQEVSDSQSNLAFWCLFAAVVAPPFVVGYSIGSLVCPEANDPASEESGPMSGYFYRERANRKWRILIVAGMVGGLNFLLMLVTSDM